MKEGILSVAYHVCLAADSEMILLGRFTKQTEKVKKYLGEILNKIIIIKRNGC